MDDCSIKISKALARWLRHRPDSIGLMLDAHGWVDVADLLSKAAATGFAFTRDDLSHVVTQNDKKRFTLSDDGLHKGTQSLSISPRLSRSHLRSSTTAQPASSFTLSANKGYFRVAGVTFTYQQRARPQMQWVGAARCP